MRKFFTPLLLLLAVSCTQLKLAREAFEQQDYQKAVTVSKEILASDSLHTDALELLSDAYMHLDHVDSALFAAERLYDIQPDNDQYRNKLYHLYIVKGEMFLQDDPKSAISIFERAEQLDATMAVAFEKKGDALVLRKQYSTAAVEFEKALERRADSLRITNKLALIDSMYKTTDELVARGENFVHDNKYDAAQKEFAAALEKMPYRKEVRFQYHMAAGKRLFNKGSKNALWDAIDNFASASLLFPDRAEPFYFLGLAYNKKDKDEYVNALDELQKAVELQPDGEWGEAAAKELTKIKARKKKMDAFWGR